MNITGGPSDLQLSKYLLGTLVESKSLIILAHLNICRTCEATIKSLEGISDTLICQLRQPLPRDLFLRENAYQRLLDALHSPYQSPTQATGGSVPHPDDFPTDWQQLDEYRLMEKLGEGGMGSVFRARHVKLHRDVALKVMSRERMCRKEAVIRFQREIQVVGKLNHPNIVQDYDASQDKDTHYLVMEFVEGLDLQQLVKQLGPLPIPEACELVRQAALGLDHAHRHHRLIHRDIKPSNLILTKQGRVKTLDLGLALIQDQPITDDHELTVEGQLIGTLDYMSPEQSDDSHVVDIRTDIYSLGATLYRLMTDKVPFSGNRYRTPAKKMRALIQDPIPSIRIHRTKIPESLSQIVEKMLVKLPDKRYSTPRAVARNLTPFSKGHRLTELVCSIDSLNSETAQSNLPANLRVQPVDIPLTPMDTNRSTWSRKGFSAVNPHGQWTATVGVLFGFMVIVTAWRMVLMIRDLLGPTIDTNAKPLSPLEQIASVPNASPPNKLIQPHIRNPKSTKIPSKISFAGEFLGAEVVRKVFFFDPINNQKTLLTLQPNIDTQLRHITELSLRLNLLMAIDPNARSGGVGCWGLLVDASNGIRTCENYFTVRLQTCCVSFDGQIIAGIDTYDNLQMMEKRGNQWSNYPLRFSTGYVRVTAIDYCEQTNRWVLGYEDGTIHLLQPSGKLDPTWKWQTEDLPITNICFSRNGDYLAASCNSPHIRTVGTILFGPVHGQLHSIPPSGNKFLDIKNFAVSANGRFLATVDVERSKVDVWKPDGNYVGSCILNDETPKSNTLRNLRSSAVEVKSFHDTRYPIPVDFVDSNEFFCAGTKEGFYHIELVSGKSHRVDGSPHQGKIVDLLYSQKGQCLASRDEYHNVCVWDLSAQALEVILHGQTSGQKITAMALSVDGTQLAIAGNNRLNPNENQIELWDITKH